MNQHEASNQSIAVIGMAGQFPQARNLGEFWNMLRQGMEGVATFVESEPPQGNTGKTKQQRVFARGVLDKAEWFDASFFGFNPREAETTDPQHRLFLETSWEALEDAGYDPFKYPGLIGVYAGMSMNTYLIKNLLTRPDILQSLNQHQLMIGNEKDFLTTRVSYKLNLRGPSYNVQTACSTSLVAVCLAAQQLLNFDCDIALAGGVSVTFPQREGYFYQEGGILSPDGHCRPFDAEGQGTVTGDGAGVVVLKRLDEAVRDGDHIYAVIRGFATNNDGSLKIGYTAPSVQGQADVIAMAQAIAGVDPSSIQYIEAHGTATPLGDPIEVEALTQVFRQGSPGKNRCALGSVKSNIGHLDVAAGVVSLMKTVLALQHKTIPPTLHFKKSNPKLNLEESPFYVNAASQNWEAGDQPRRAGVNAFGIGGTNAHVVLEEAPETTISSTSGEEVFVLSARSMGALNKMSANLASHLRHFPTLRAADVAHTLQVGRREFNHRLYFVAQDLPDAVNKLEHPESLEVYSDHLEGEPLPILFLFPGQGAAQLGMARGCYESFPRFRHYLDQCADILLKHCGWDLRQKLFHSTDAALLAQTDFVQPALFAVEFSLARWLQDLGLKPSGCLGHSLGEITAACLCGLFSLEEALSLVVDRGLIMQRMPEGAMLAVRSSAEEITRLLPQGLSIAALNSKSQTVISGPRGELEKFQESLSSRNIPSKFLGNARAFHSKLVEGILPSWQARLEKVQFQKPHSLWVSNVSGKWIDPQVAQTVDYWVQHARSPVQFEESVTTVLQQSSLLLVEVGPGQILGRLVGQHSARKSTHRLAYALPLIGETPEPASFLSAVGQIWLSGHSIDWSLVKNEEPRYRVSLPTYPFERKRYWVEPGIASGMTVPPQVLGLEQIPAEPPENPGKANSPCTSEGRVLEKLKRVLAEMSGIDLKAMTGKTTFLELGFDSLAITQIRQNIEKHFGVSIKFRQIMDDLPSLGLMADYLNRHEAQSKETGLEIPSGTRGSKAAAHSQPLLTPP